MKIALIHFAWLILLAGQIALAQPPGQRGAHAPTAPTGPAVEDFKPSVVKPARPAVSQVNSERRARFRIVAPQAQSVTVNIGGGAPADQGRGRRLGRHHAAVG